MNDKNIQKALEQIDKVSNLYLNKSEAIWNTFGSIIHEGSLNIPLTELERIFRGFTYDLDNIKNALLGEEEE